MGNFKRLGLPLVFLTILGLALSSSVSSSFYKVSLGSVTLYDEDRVTKVELIVPIESSLFGNSNNYNEDAVTSLRDLALSCSSYCTRLDQDAGNHSKLTWGAAGSEEPLSSEEVKNLKHKYQLALEELVEAQDLEVDQIKSTVLQNAIRPVVQQLPNTKGTTVKVVGCTSGSEFVIELTSGAAIDSDVPIKMVEVADYGRFVNDKKAFVRIDIAQHWAHNKNSGAWYRVDFARCQKSDKTVGFICPESSLSYANECTPADVNGCPVKVDFVKDNFVTNFYMPNGSMVVASNMQQFNTHKTFNIHMPASGVILVDLTSDERITFEQVKIKPMEGAGLPVFKWTSVNTQAHMLFADTHVYEADFDPSGWAFQLSTDGSGDIVTITGRRTGAVFVAAAFIVANLWWCVVVSVAVVLSVALTLLTLFCRGRISSTYRHYSPRLQRKRAPSASRSESSTSSTTEEDPELGVADEEFETARKKKLNFANFKISFLGDKGEKLTDRAPTAMSVASDDSADSWRSRYYKNLRQLVSLQSLKAAKKITDDEDAISNIATDGSETDKTTTADVELTAVKVVEKQEKPKTGVNVGILDVAKFLENSSIPEADLVDARHTMLRTRRKPNGENADRMLMNLVDFFALIKYGPGITAEEYNKIKEQEGLPREDCSRFGYALKGLHLKYTLNAGRIYRFHHLVRKFPKTYIIEDSQMGKTTMDQLYKCNFGVELKYPGLPVVAVYPPGGHREFLPIECLQVCEDQELVFASIRLARLAALAEKNMKSAEARVKAELQQQQTKITANTAPQAAAKAQPAH